MTCKPTRWLVLAPVAALPFLAALTFGTAKLEERLLTEAAVRLESQGAAWARVQFEGRDAILSGNAPSVEALSEAEATIGAMDGVRIVVSRARTVAPAN